MPKAHLQLLELWIAKPAKSPPNAAPLAIMNLSEVSIRSQSFSQRNHTCIFQPWCLSRGGSTRQPPRPAVSVSDLGASSEQKPTYYCRTQSFRGAGTKALNDSRSKQRAIRFCPCRPNTLLIINHRSHGSFIRDLQAAKKMAEQTTLTGRFPILRERGIQNRFWLRRFSSVVLQMLR